MPDRPPPADGPGPEGEPIPADGPGPEGEPIPAGGPGPEGELVPGADPTHPAAPDGDPAPPRTEATHRVRARIARLPVLVVVVVVLVVGIVVGRADSHGVASTAAAPGGPAAAPRTALSSSWFCAGATTGGPSPAPGQLVVSNAGSSAVTGRITLLGTDGGTHSGRRSESVSIGADDRRTIPETLAGPLRWVGAIVDIDAGAVTVEQQVTGPLGTAASPCATTGSNAWYFAAGATLVNASSEITLLNPYPTPAIANLSFTTNEGQEAPSQFSGIVVPAGGIAAVDLGSHLRRRSAIATSVTTSYGRVVAWKTDVVSVPRRGTPLLGTKAALAVDADPASAVPGVTVMLGAPGTSTLWRWPEGSTASGVDEQYVIYNPGTRTANLALAVDLDASTATAEPLDLTVGPQETTTITTGEEARIPAGSGYSATLTSRNGVPVVAERTVSMSAPAAGRGIGEMLGATRTSSSWLVGAGSVGRHSDEIIAISNPSSARAAHHGAVVVTLEALDAGRLGPVLAGGSGRAPATAIGPMTVRAGSRVQLDLGTGTATVDAAIVVRASGPVVVERDLVGRHPSTGVSISLAVPLGP